MKASHLRTATCLTFLTISIANGSAPLFDRQAVRDPSTLEIKVLQDWKPAKDPAILQKLIEITLCEWWPGQKVRLTLTLNAPANGQPCQNIVIANQPLGRRATAPTRGQLTLPFEYDKWDSAPLRKTGRGTFATTITLESTPERIDFLSLHTHTENELALTLSSPYRRLEPNR